MAVKIAYRVYPMKYNVCMLFCVVLLDIDQSYPKNANIRGTLVGNKIVDHSDVVGVSPVAAAPTTSSFLA